jgi:hypothetical protein
MAGMKFSIESMANEIELFHNRGEQLLDCPLGDFEKEIPLSFPEM